MTSVILTEIIYVFEFVFAHFLACSYLEVSICKYAKSGLFFISLTLLDTIADIMIFSVNFSWLINLVIMLLFLYFVFRCTFTDTILLYCIVYSTCMIIQLTIALIFYLTPFSFSENFMSILGNILSLLIALLIYNHVPLSEIFRYIKSKNNIIQAIIIDLFFILLMANLYLKNDKESFYDFLFILIVMLSLLLLLNVEVAVNQSRMMQQSKQLKAYEDYLPIVEELINHVRSRQHEFSNQNLAICSMPTIYKDYDSLVAAMSEYNLYISKKIYDHVLLRINMVLLAGFLFQKSQQAVKENKKLDIIIRNPNLQTTVPEYELIDFIGILVDNELEATSEGSTATLIIDSYDNKIEFITKNYGAILTPEIIDQLFTKSYTTKTTDKMKHGFGLYNLNQLVNKYHGSICVSNETDPETGETLIVFEVVV